MGQDGPVRVLVAPDSFKGTLDAARVAWAVRRGWLSVRPEDEVRSLPLADGGEGSLEVLAAALEGSTLETVPLVHGPDGRPVDAQWLASPDGTAVVELARSGKLDPVTGDYQLIRETTDLTEMVRQIAGDFAEAAAKKHLDLRWAAADDLPVVEVDRAMLRSAFTNLVENAVKYTPDEGRVEIELKRNGSQVVFRVSDNGYGIRPEDQAHLFDRHVRVHRKEWKRVKGSGLGLFIVRSVARRHGGDAWVESEIDVGSSFFVAIPLESANLPGASGG